MNPASGAPVKWIRRIAKITIFASFCMNPAPGDPNYYFQTATTATTATATTAAAAADAKMVCFQCQERQSKPLGKALLHALSNHAILRNVVRFSVSGTSIQALETWQKSRFFNEVVCFQIRERQSKRPVTL